MANGCRCEASANGILIDTDEAKNHMAHAECINDVQVWSGDFGISIFLQVVHDSLKLAFHIVQFAELLLTCGEAAPKSKRSSALLSRCADAEEASELDLFEP